MLLCPSCFEAFSGRGLCAILGLSKKKHDVFDGQHQHRSWLLGLPQFFLEWSFQSNLNNKIKSDFLQVILPTAKVGTQF